MRGESGAESRFTSRGKYLPVSPDRSDDRAAAPGLKLSLLPVQSMHDQHGRLFRLDPSDTLHERNVRRTASGRSNTCAWTTVPDGGSAQFTMTASGKRQAISSSSCMKTLFSWNQAGMMCSGGNSTIRKQDSSALPERNISWPIFPAGRLRKAVYQGPDRSRDRKRLPPHGVLVGGG